MKSRFIYPMLVATSAHLWIADAAAAACEPWVAKLASVQGRVEGQSAAGAEWRAAEPGQSFCPGDKIRTLE
ncbi:MAG TPA: hypothetical protein VLU73_06275, partial [Methylococcaceae bacterium]|nr:hypothetical protein [Methylococcaceae bacterium]